MGSSQTRDQTHAPAVAGKFLTTELPGKSPKVFKGEIGKQKRNQKPEKGMKWKKGTDMCNIAGFENEGRVP